MAKWIPIIHVYASGNMSKIQLAWRSSLNHIRFTKVTGAPNRKLTRRSFLGLMCALLLVSCGTAGNRAQASSSSLPNLVSPGTVSVEKGISNTVSSPAVFSLRSSPSVSLAGPLFISKGGFLVAAEANGNQSDIFQRAKPLAKWRYMGSIPGKVAQLDFDSLNSGFALVGATIFSTDSLYSTSDGGRHWKLVSTGRYVQVHFFSSQNGVALASPPSGPGLGAEILITSDGGRSWTQQPSSALSRVGVFGSNYASFSFISDKVGWLAIGGQPAAGSEEKWLLTTVNGGKSWTQVCSTPPLSSPATTQPNSPGLPMGGYLSQVRFMTPSLGYLVLARGGRGGVLKTVDGGLHWSGEQLLPSNDYRTTAIKEFAPSTPFGGIAITQAGSIWNQANTAVPWKEIYPPYRAMSISFGSGKIDISTEKGRVLALDSNPSNPPKVLGNFGINTESVNIIPGGEIAITSTGIEMKPTGKAWVKVPGPAARQLNEGRFLSSSVGLVVPGPQSSALDATLNGGRSWTKVPLPFLPFSVDPVGSTNWWVIGEVLGPLIPNPYKKNIHVRTYALYHTTNAGRSWTEYKTSWGRSGILVGVNFSSSSVGYAWTESTLFSTTNGGKTFVSHRLPNYQLIPNPTSLASVSGGRAWIVSDGYPIFETKDSGATWFPFG